MYFLRLKRQLYGFAITLMCIFFLMWLVVNQRFFTWIPRNSDGHVVDSIQQIHAVQRRCVCESSLVLENNSSILREINTKLSNVLDRVNTTAKANKVKSDNKTIDIVNDYYPFVDFKFVFPQISPTNVDSRDLFMVVLVNSGATTDYRKRREAIRQTWGNRSNCEQRKASGNEKVKDLKWLLVFVVGKAGPGTNDDELNMAEARQHNDMLIGNITENYLNNIIKFYMGQVWASKFDIKYTMKTDDDVYVRIPRVLEYLVNAKFPRPFYGGWTYAGTLVNRKIGGKWTVSWKYYGEKDWPRFNPGAFFILSSDLLNRLFNYVYIRKPFHTDDAYVGVAMRDFRVRITTISTFRIDPDMNKQIPKLKDCYLLGKTALGHNVDPIASKILFDRYETMLCGNIPKKC
ncbi:beta-1,3-galactosyltransferase 5-like [Paramuricea clavata]|uniref:Hexosyltransferase n=1 Tax=Paramuricea clavata TaxID=317549 RepID=A0A7D9JM16_PARCT|nr:beta-1,3-galactosyltransferase 5-like [Paramuricea clavata]